MKTTKEAAAQYCCVKIGGLTITYSQKRAHYPPRSQNIAFFQLTVVDGPAHCLSLGSEKFLIDSVYSFSQRSQARNGTKQDDCMSYKCVNASTIECTRRGRQPGGPSGEAALAPLKGELAARTG